MIYRAINGLIRHAIEAELITNDDIFVVRNQCPLPGKIDTKKHTKVE